MRFMILVKANEESEAGVLPSQEMLAEMGKYNEELRQGRGDARGRGAAPDVEGRARPLLRHRQDRDRRALHRDQRATWPGSGCSR